MKAYGSFCVGLLLATHMVTAVLPATAAEGTTAAGPNGGTDIRSALLPPPGVYGGLIGLYSSVGQINDGSGNAAPGLDAVNLSAAVVGGMLAYVPGLQDCLGGRSLSSDFYPAARNAGRLFPSSRRDAHQASVIPTSRLTGPDRSELCARRMTRALSQLSRV